MARSFNGSTQAITIAKNLSSFNQITLAFWLNWTTFADNDALACEFSTNYGSNTGAFICDPNSANPVGKFYFGVGSGSAVTTGEFTRPSAGVWHHYLALMDGTQAGSNAIPTVYVDGTSVSLAHSNTASATFTFGNYTLYLMSRAATSLWGAGSMADFTIWGGALLTAGEAGALAAGVRPQSVRPSSIALFLPLDGLQSPEPDFSGTTSNGTLVASPAFAAGPPTTLFTPKPPTQPLSLPTPPPSTATIYAFDQMAARFSRNITTIGY